MKDDKVAGVWAQALLELAISAGRLEQVMEGSALAAAALASDPVHDLFLSSPRIEPGRKKGVLGAALQGKADDLLLDFAGLMIDRNRGGFLGAALSKFGELYAAATGRAKAVVVTAVPLDPAVAARISKQLSALYKRKVDVEARTDPGVIGGMSTQVGDSRIDSTVLRDLRELRARMLAAKV